VVLSSSIIASQSSCDTNASVLPSSTENGFARTTTTLFTYNMEPPFTRERLHNLKAEVDAKMAEEKLQKTVDDIKKSILWVVLNPTSTPSGGLGAVSRLEHERGAPPIYTKALITFNKIRYATPINPVTGNADMNGGGHPPLSTVVERVKAIFPDCTFQTDPLNTYMIIDWS